MHIVFSFFLLKKNDNDTTTSSFVSPHTTQKLCDQKIIEQKILNKKMEKHIGQSTTAHPHGRHENPTTAYQEMSLTFWSCNAFREFHQTKKHSQ